MSDINEAGSVSVAYLTAMLAEDFESAMKVIVETRIELIPLVCAAMAGAVGGLLNQIANDNHVDRNEIAGELLRGLGLKYAT